MKFRDKEKQKENKMADTQAVKTGRKKDGGHASIEHRQALKFREENSCWL